MDIVYVNVMGSTSVYYPRSNEKIEQFHDTIKSEAIRKQIYLSIDDARRQIDRYVHYYNEERLHSGLYYLIPNEVCDNKTKQRLKERQDNLDKAAQMRRKLSLNDKTKNSISL